MNTLVSSKLGADKCILLVAGGMDAGSQFRRGVGGPLVGGVDIMMSSDPRTIVHLACSPLLHYAFRVAKLRGWHGDDGNPYRVVRQYGAHARTPRAREDASLMHNRAMRGSPRARLYDSNRDYASTRLMRGSA